MWVLLSVGFHYGSLLMLSLFLGLCTVWMLAMLPKLEGYTMPPSSVSKWLRCMSVLYVYRLLAEEFYLMGAVSHLFPRWFLAWLILRPWRWSDTFLRTVRLLSKELHDVISQKTALFLTTAVRTSNRIEITSWFTRRCLRVTSVHIESVVQRNVIKLTLMISIKSNRIVRKLTDLLQYKLSPSCEFLKLPFIFGNLKIKR
jgi:hypothetical protein